MGLLKSRRKADRVQLSRQHQDLSRYGHDRGILYRFQVSDYMEKVFKIYGDYAPVLRNFDREMLKGESKVDEY